MGIKINAQQNENKAYVHAVGEFMELYMLKFFSILKRFRFYYLLTADYKKEQKCLKVLKNMTRIVVENKRKEREGKQKDDITDENEFGIKKKVAFLDVLMNLEDGDVLTNEEINDEVNTFLFGVCLLFIIIFYYYITEFYL